MKIAVVADIHGNRDALQAVLADIHKRGIQTIYNLGDNLYGPLFPLETYELLVEAKVQSLMGNCDRMLLGDASNPTLRYVQNLLGDKHRQWITNLPAAIETDDFYFCHGTPASDEVYMLENIGANGSTLKKTEEIMNYVQDIQQQIIFCAHTHIPRVVYLPNNKIIINPGSVGLPAYEEELPIYHKMESGSPFAHYTLVSKEQDNWLIEQVLIGYDRQEVINKSKGNGRLDWTCALETGRM